MTNKAAFTPEEWWLLKETPLKVGAAVMVASDSGLGLMQEIVANATAMANASQMFPQNELIQALMAPVEENDLPKTRARPSSAVDRLARREEVQTDAVQLCRHTADLLERKVFWQEAHEYKMWVMALGADVARAAKEGGVMGFGAKAITEEESKMLERVAEALGYSAYTPPSE